jgi:hypothetical protein
VTLENYEFSVIKINKKNIIGGKSTLGSVQSTVEDGVEQLGTVLCEIETRLHSENVAGINRLRWPFDEIEISHFIDRVERYKSTFIFALNIAQM